jgi:hypothetical protein
MQSLSILVIGGGIGGSTPFGAMDQIVTRA